MQEKEPEFKSIRRVKSHDALCELGGGEDAKGVYFCEICNNYFWTWPPIQECLMDEVGCPKCRQELLAFKRREFWDMMEAFAVIFAILCIMSVVAICLQ